MNINHKGPSRAINFAAAITAMHAYAKRVDPKLIAPGFARQNIELNLARTYPWAIGTLSNFKTDTQKSDLKGWGAPKLPVRLTGWNIIPIYSLGIGNTVPRKVLRRPSIKKAERSFATAKARLVQQHVSTVFSPLVGIRESSQRPPSTSEPSEVRIERNPAEENEGRVQNGGPKVVTRPGVIEALRSTASSLQNNLRFRLTRSSYISLNASSLSDDARGKKPTTPHLDAFAQLNPVRGRSDKLTRKSESGLFSFTDAARTPGLTASLPRGNGTKSSMRDRGMRSDPGRLFEENGQGVGSSPELGDTREVIYEQWMRELQRRERTQF